MASENYLTRGATIGVQHIIIPPPQKKDREVETHKLYSVEHHYSASCFGEILYWDHLFFPCPRSLAAAGAPWGHHARTVIRSAPMTPAAKPPPIPSRAIGLKEIKLDPYIQLSWTFLPMEMISPMILIERR